MRNKLTTMPDPTNLMAWSMGRNLQVHAPVTPLFLLDCQVAGMAYYDGDKCRDALEVNMKLGLRRQPDNPHDPLAIEILFQPIFQTTCKEAVKLGYVPRRHNPVLARLMDAGKKLEVRINEIQRTRILQPHSDGLASPWVELRVSLFLDET